MTEGGLFSHYAYDNTGHPTTDGIKEFVYDQNRRLSQVKSGGTVLGEYTYDGKGRRVIKSASGATTIYHYDLSGRLIAETDAAGNLLVDYVYLGAGPLAMVRKTGGTEAAYYYYNDHLGTPRAMTDQSGTVVCKVPFDAFGNELAGDVKAIENNLRFPGQYFDAESGLHYNCFRDYDPKTGRYIEPDPVGLDGGMNLYPYVGNNPVNFVDPLGLTKSDPWYGYNDRDFQWWFHNCWKDKVGPRVRSKEEIAEGYVEWVRRGSPRGHKCWKKENECDNRSPWEQMKDAWDNFNEWMQEHMPKPHKGPAPGVPPGPFPGPVPVPI